jgi:hypothetical protein
MDTDKFSKKETEQRIKAAVQGAFAGPPTPLKDIPKKNGESRLLKGRKRKRTEIAKRSK